VLGLRSAVTWGAGDFGGGLLSRRAPLFGVIAVTQVTGLAAALAIALARGERIPEGTDVGWSLAAGVSGVIGMSALYRGLAVGRMGVVAPTTGVIGASVPVVVGFALEGVPRPVAVAGIVTALLAVVLVTRSPGHAGDRPSGFAWALLAGSSIGLFNISIGELSSAGAFAPLVLIRLVQAVLVVLVVVAWRQPWRLDAWTLRRVLVVGLLDTAGNASFIVAAQTGALAIAAVLSSLYPVVTVVLAVALLHERITRRHVAGIALTAVAIALISVGTAGP
jgi:drug/metabolite transporter (DMT)-like permease